MPVVVKVTSKGQFTLPMQYRKSLGINKDSYLLIDEVGNFLVLEKLQKLDQITKILQTQAKEKKITKEELLKTLKKIQAEKMECMKIFLDANILISGIIFKGKEHELLIKNKNILFITSEDVLEETRAVITEKFSESSELVEIFLNILNPTVIKRKDYASKLNEYSTVRDRNDRHILAAAMIGKVDYIVTGDADLLSLKTYDNISIVQSRKMLFLLK